MILLLFSHEVINQLAGSCQSRGNRTPPGANRHAAHDSSCVKIAGAMSSSTGVENRLKLASAVSPGSAQVSGRGWRAIAARLKAQDSGLFSFSFGRKPRFHYINHFRNSHEFKSDLKQSKDTTQCRAMQSFTGEYAKQSISLCDAAPQTGHA